MTKLFSMVFFIKLSLWALAFVPLIIAESVFFPFIFGKVVMIRVFVALVSILFAVHVIANADFRRGVYGRLKLVAKNPLFVTTTTFVALSIVSTIFATNPFRAFFGDVERGEGLIGLLYFYGFFVYSLLVFEKKDWMWFFRLNLFTGAVLFTKALVEISEGSVRPGSFTGNPAFLGGYFLFVIFAALASFYYSKKEPIWKFFSAAMLLLGTIGLFLTQTRSAMAGLVVGVLALVIYSALHGKAIVMWKGFSLRTVAFATLAAMVVVGSLFGTTKESPLWQRVPGFNRIANFTLMDATVQTRLISLGVSKNAIDPQKNGMQKFLIGWGPENFGIAYNKYYNPEYYQYEHTWFDRAHNKLMDVAVMNGMLGLLAYMGMWVSVAWLVFRRKGFSFDMMAALFFGGAFFFNLLFVFDQVSTIIPLFAFFAFLAYVSTVEDQLPAGGKEKKTQVMAGVREYATYGMFGAAGLFFTWALIFWTIVPYSQMSTYLTAIGTKNAAGILQNPEAIFEPYTFAQQDIRGHFLNVLTQYYGKEQQLTPLIDDSIRRMEELIAKEPTNPRYFIMIASAYHRRARAGDGLEYFKKAEAYYRKAAELAPMRQDVMYAIAFNLSFQGRVDEAIAVLRTVLTVDDVSPETHYFLGAILTEKGGGDYREALKEMEIAMSSPTYINFKDEQTVNIYQLFLKRTYAARDSENFLIVAKRLEIVDPPQAEMARQMGDMVRKGQWPAINFD